MIRKAKVPDVPHIHALINYYAEKDEMLPRSLNAIYENIRDFFVLEEDGRLAGCCALHVTWEDLGEIKSLAVEECAKGSGGGKQLVQHCLDEAREMGMPHVFALTYLPDFFVKLGFARTDKSALPHKIWSECINCPKFPDCGEEAVVIEF
ncbi:MAG: GNAT family N-acetyltransferase [Armatimonadetes bacterium RBG_16_58_9]|nr:MAG: GNAT family N-acetyltransferase [Armatimonadetes bacterium RBG_16_58_9]